MSLLVKSNRERPEKLLLSGRSHFWFLEAVSWNGPPGILANGDRTASANPGSQRATPKNPHREGTASAVPRKCHTCKMFVNKIERHN
jgi:hypothetical protein